jgi:transposase
MFSYVSLNARVPTDHPLRRLRLLVDAILANMSGLFDASYSHTGRPSIPPEHLLRALLLQILATCSTSHHHSAPSAWPGAASPIIPGPMPYLP